MYIIAGLGNPTSRYRGTRHNIGFEAIDYLSDAYDIPVDNKKHKALCGTGVIAGKKVILAKPQTFMNSSGESVRALIDFYKADAKKDLIVIYDDVHLGVGQLRIRKRGSAGGHNGIKSIIAHLGTEEFHRIRIGVGETPEQYGLIDYVLGRFSREDSCKMEDALFCVSKAVAVMLTDGADAAMNLYNQKVEP